MQNVTRARAVIIGAGIVGNAMAWHLAKLGWRDLMLVDTLLDEVMDNRTVVTDSLL